VLASAIRALALATFALGTLLALYAAMLLPDEIDRGQNPYGRPRRLLQFGFACAVPLAGFFASRRASRGELGSAVRALTCAAGALLGWIVTFFNWN
jgi:hypothetical protein